jgi:hypothetical protein
VSRVASPTATGTSGVGQASCPAGRKLIGGGAGWEGGPTNANLQITNSGPVDSSGSFATTQTGDTPTSWYGTGHNATGSSQTLYVWALCAA